MAAFRVHDEHLAVDQHIKGRVAWLYHGIELSDRSNSVEEDGRRGADGGRIVDIIGILAETAGRDDFGVSPKTSIIPTI